MGRREVRPDLWGLLLQSRAHSLEGTVSWSEYSCLSSSVLPNTADPADTGSPVPSPWGPQLKPSLAPLHAR